MGLIGVYKLAYDYDRKCSLIKERDIGYDANFCVKEAKDVYHILESAFSASTQVEEYMYLMCCDSSMRVLGLFVVSSGSVNNTLQNIRGVFMRALMCNAACIIVGHNHPSGNSEPSRDDKLCYEKLNEASELMEISLVENIIIGDGEYYSFRENRKVSVS